MMEDQQPEIAQPKKEWVSPAVERLVAGNAEGGDSATGDLNSLS